MELTYRGPNGAGVHVPIDGGVLFFPPGKAVDAPDELAKRLLEEQPAVWSSEDDRAPKAKRKQAATPDEGKE